MRLRVRLVLLALCLPSGLAACVPSGGDDHKESPLIHTDDDAPRPVDVARAAVDPDEAARAVTLRQRDAAARLGAYHLVGTHGVRVSENGTEVEALDETTTIDRAAGGAYFAQYANSKDYGRDVYFQPASGGAAAGTLWLRPRYGKFHRRAPATPDEPARVLDEIFGTFAADYDLVARFATVSDLGESTLLGRRVRKIGLGAGNKRARPRQTDPARAWRDETAVESLQGEVTLDVETGALIAGTLEARVAFVDRGRSYVMALVATHSLTEVGGQVTVTPPGEADSATTPERSTELEDRDDLLRGLAPPAPKAPTPQGDKPQPDKPAPPGDK